VIAHADSQNDPASTPGAAAVPGEEAPAPPEAPNPLEPLWETLSALREYLALYVAAQADSFRLRVRKLVLAAVGGLLALLAGAAVVMAAAALIVRGIAGGLTRLLGGQAWAGDLLTGVLVLATVGLLTYFAMRGAVRASRQRTVNKYERRRDKQRTAFGRHAGQRAGQQDPAAETRAGAS